MKCLAKSVFLLFSLSFKWLLSHANLRSTRSSPVFSWSCIHLLCLTVCLFAKQIFAFSRHTLSKINSGYFYRCMTFKEPSLSCNLLFHHFCFVFFGFHACSALFFLYILPVFFISGSNYTRHFLPICVSFFLPLFLLLFSYFFAFTAFFSSCIHSLVCLLDLWHLDNSAHLASHVLSYWPFFLSFF